MGRADYNNFDCIRLFAAILVLVSHSFALAGTSDIEPFIWWFGYESGGQIGVVIFFVISGYLVSGSLERRSTMDYLTARALRIIPALVLVTCFEVFVIGPAFTRLPLPAYFSDNLTWQHLANPLIYRFTFQLPGVFGSLPVTAVNGSLWTLPAECGLYLLLPAAAFCGALTKRGAAIAFVACCAAHLIATGYFGLNGSNEGPAVIRGISALIALKFSTFFLAGAALWVWRDVIPVHAGGALVCCLILFAVAGTSSAVIAYFLCLPYVVLFAATKLPVISLGKIGDLSYGTYLFAFPVQQSIVATFGVGQISPYLLSLFAIPAVLLLAFLSWRFVEAPALRMGRRKPDTKIVSLAAA